MVNNIIKLKNSKLNRKLLNKLIVIFVVTIMYIVFITSNNIKAIEENRLEDINNLLAESYSKVSNNIVNQAFENGESLRIKVERLMLLENVDRVNLKQLVEPALLSQDGVKGIYILLKDNNKLMNPYWFKENGRVKFELVEDAKSLKYWDPIANSDRGYVKPQVYDVNNKKILLTTLEIPIKNKDNVVGIIGIDLSLDFFESLSNNIKSIEGIEISIVSYDGMIIIHTDNNLVGHSIYEFDEAFKALSVEDIIESNSEELNDKHTLHTKFNMGIKDKQWHIIVSMPKILINNNANTTSIHIAITGLFALIIMIILTSLTVHRALSPINEVCDVLDRAYKGDLGARALITSGDEIENIGKGLNELLSSLEENKKELESEVCINQELNIELGELMKNNDRIYFDTIRSLVKTIEAKDIYTRGHCDRVTKYSLMIGRRIGLLRKEMINLNYGAILHDIGKIGISENILCKVDKLTDEEFDEIKQHPQKGFEIVKDIHFLKDSINVIIHHHERYDGDGYPDGLVGENIDLLSRIVSIADAYDAMTSTRSYRSALTKQNAKEELMKNKGTQFDPVLVDTFVGLLETESDVLLKMQINVIK